SSLYSRRQVSMTVRAGSRQADRHRQPRVIALALLWFHNPGHGRAKALCDLLCPHQVQLPASDEELLAAPARDDVIRATARAQAPCDLRKRSIAGGMAIARSEEHTS